MTGELPPTTLPQPRHVVREIPRYRAGRPPAVVAGLRGYKLSSNENPFEPLPEVLAAARQALVLNRYPDATALPLREALAEHHGVGADTIETGTGSLDVLNKILLAFGGMGEGVVCPVRSSSPGGRSSPTPSRSGWRGRGRSGWR